MIMMQADHMKQTFPLAFQDVHYMALLYSADPTAVDKHLQNTGLKPALFFFGKPVVAIGLIQYKASDLGAYNEIILSIPVVLKDHHASHLSNWLDLYAGFEKRKGGQYIIHIPVTSQLSVDGGRNLWGYPKTLEPIRHQFTQNKIESSLDNPEGHPIMTWKGSLGPGILIPTMNLMTYSFMENQLMKTTVDVKARMKWYPLANIQLSVDNDESEMAKNVQLLGLPSKKPLAVLGAARFSALFHAPLKMH